MTSISRKALFEKAWSQPLTKVAAEFGVTSTALKRTCDRHDIPTPGRGYWAQVAAGEVFPKPLLRPAPEGRSEEVQILGAPPMPEAVRAAYDAAKAKIEAQGSAPSRDRAPSSSVEQAKASSETAAVTPSRTSGSGPLEHRGLALTRKALARAKPDSEGFLRISGKGVVGMTIAEASVVRAVAWLDLLVEGAEGQAGHLEATAGGVALVMDGEPISFRLDEKPTRTPHVPTAKELAVRRERTWGADPWPKYDNSPSGQLAFLIDGNSYSGLRRTFADGRTQRLEAMTADILAAMVGHATFTQTRRREVEAAARERALEAARREQVQAFEARETRRRALVDAIHVELEARARLAAVLAHIQRSDDPEPLTAMVAWLERQLKQIDSLLSPTAIEISARYAEIEFDEARDRARAGSPRYYWKPAELRLWSMDSESGVATSQSPLDWAIVAGLIPPIVPAEVEAEQP